MNRRTFLFWFWLSWLTATLSNFVAQANNKNRQKLKAKTQKSLTTIVYYVAPNGNDNALGTPEQPFATIERARNAIRQLKQQDNQLKQSVTVFIRGGTYYLSTPLEFLPEDSGTVDFPINYIAYKNEKPILSGGRRITGWRRQGNLWMTVIPEVKAGKWNFRLLRVADSWATRARYPNFDPANPLKGGWLYVDGSQLDKDRRFKDGNGTIRDRIPIDPLYFPQWQNWEGAEISIFMRYNYGNAIFPITDVDRVNNALIGNFVNSGYTTNAGCRFFIENVREALDSPGEWYLDKKTGELLYWAKETNFPDLEVVAPVLDRLIVLRGDRQRQSFVEYVNFQGLTFTDSSYPLSERFLSVRDAAIWFSVARNCSIQDCTFVRLGGYGLYLESESYSNQIINNKFSDLGQGGILLIGKKLENQPRKNLLRNNDISACGKIYKNVAGINVITSSENQIIGNRIAQMPRYGISLKSPSETESSHNNLVEFNQIIDSNLETSDSGAIETLGRDKQFSSNIIRFNWIENVVGLTTTREGEIITPYFSWGIYLDDYSSGTTVFKNVVVGTVQGGIMIHGGRDNLIENNIFINGAKYQIQLWQKGKFMSGNVFRRNLVVYQDPKAVIWYSNSKLSDKIVAESDYNLYWYNGKLNAIEKINSPANQLAKQKIRGYDRNSIVADPLFIEPQKGDYNLNRTSPAFKLGFKPISLARISPKRL
jgi:parallel beta-helix repeat protein